MDILRHVSKSEYVPKHEACRCMQYLNTAIIKNEYYLE